MQLKCNIYLQDTIHVPSIQNDIDEATRNQPTPSLTKDKFIDFNNNRSIIDILSLCDPTKQESYQYYQHMLFQFQVLIDRINENLTSTASEPTYSKGQSQPTPSSNASPTITTC